MISTDSHVTRGMALVTGGSRGIGAAICQRLAVDGYAVAVGYANNADAARVVVSAIADAGGTARAFQVDVGELDSIEALFVAAEEALGPLAVLVANAGISGEFGRLADYSIADMEQIIRVNTLAPMVCAQAAIRRLSTRTPDTKGHRGSIVVMSSVAARLGGGGAMVPYATSKGAMETFITGLGNELAGEGIRINGVAPGIIDTDMPPPKLRQMVENVVPMKRLGKPEEIADTVAWLVSDQASFVTGQSITVSGGR